MYYYLSLMKFDDEFRWGLQISFFELSLLEKDYYYLIPISKEQFDYLDHKFYRRF